MTRFYILCLLLLTTFKIGYTNTKLTKLKIESDLSSQRFPLLNFEELKCTACQILNRGLVNTAHLIDGNFEPIKDIICKIVEKKGRYSYQICSNVVSRFRPSAITTFIRLLSERKGFLCTIILKQCQETDLRIFDHKKLIAEILRDTPELKPKNPTKKQTYKILTITDFHIDPYYQVGAPRICDNEVICCRNTSIPKPGHENARAGKWSSGNDCDIPPHTADAMLRFANKTVSPDMIYYLGDNEGHNIDSITKDDNNKVASIIGKMIKKNFPKTPSFIAIGNHETFPVDVFDVNSENDQWLFDGLEKGFKEIIPDLALKQLKMRGFYSFYLKEKNLRIISIFSQTYDSLNLYLLGRQFDPMGQIAWLRETLEEAERTGEDVHIISHIPFGSSTCFVPWAEIINALINRYRNVITNIFSGHTHWDEIKLIKDFRDEQKPILANLISPSLTTFGSQNPTFRVYEVDAETNKVVDYHQYIMDYKKWNQLESNDPTFELSYKFKKEYDLKNLEAEGLKDFMNKIENGIKPYADKYRFHLTSPYGPSPNTSDENADNKDLICSLKDDAYKSMKCLTEDSGLGSILPDINENTLAKIFPVYLEYLNNKDN